MLADYSRFHQKQNDKDALIEAVGNFVAAFGVKHTQKTREHDPLKDWNILAIYNLRQQILQSLFN